MNTKWSINGDLHFLIVLVSTHGAAVLHMAHEVRIPVKLLVVLQTVGMEHMRTIQQYCLLVEYKWTVTYRALIVASLHGLLLDLHPHGTELWRISLGSLQTC